MSLERPSALFGLVHKLKGAQGVHTTQKYIGFPGIGECS